MATLISVLRAGRVVSRGAGRLAWAVALLWATHAWAGGSAAQRRTLKPGLAPAGEIYYSWNLDVYNGAKLRAAKYRGPTTMPRGAEANRGLFDYLRGFWQEPGKMQTRGPGLYIGVDPLEIDRSHIRSAEVGQPGQRLRPADLMVVEIQGPASTTSATPGSFKDEFRWDDRFKQLWRDANSDHRQFNELVEADQTLPLVHFYKTNRDGSPRDGIVQRSVRPEERQKGVAVYMRLATAADADRLWDRNATKWETSLDLLRKIRYVLRTDPSKWDVAMSANTTRFFHHLLFDHGIAFFTWMATEGHPDWLSSDRLCFELSALIRTWRAEMSANELRAALGPEAVRALDGARGGQWKTAHALRALIDDPSHQWLEK